MKKKILYGTDGKPVQDFMTFLIENYHFGEIVGYIADGTDTGTYHRSAEELIESLEKYPDDLGATIGDWDTSRGAQIRINPLDGKGVKTENITRFSYAVVRSNATPVPEQLEIFKKFKIPIAAMIKTSDKELDVIVRIDARDPDEYKSRVSYLYDFLDKHGCLVNRNLRHPTSLVTLPGAEKNGITPHLLETNAGFGSWDAWYEYAEASDDDLPEFESLDRYMNDPPVPPDELIKGILRKGHKMIISGDSKAGKSFLLMQQGIAIATGGEWLGFKCNKGRVLYVNLEIDRASAINRFISICDAHNISMTDPDQLVLWNLRGRAVPLDQLVPKLLYRIQNQHFDAIIIDPIYKVITGDENSASDMAYFCNQFDKICNAAGCATIYCHHHPKSPQNYAKAINRASGSGVFGRDPDAILDLSELELPDEIKADLEDNHVTAWRMESTLREFAEIDPVNIWFKYPLHLVDDAGVLDDLPNKGTSAAGRMKNRFSKTSQEAEDAFRRAFDACNVDGAANVQDMCDYLNLSDKTIYARIKKLDNEFYLEKGKVYRNSPDA